MNISDPNSSRNDNLKKNTDSDRGSLNNSSTFGDYLNLKVAAIPAKYYKLIQCEKSKITEYNHIVEKIRSQSALNSYAIILLIKSNGRPDIKIKNENDWRFYIENNTIIELIDSKNTLKIEYGFIKNTENPDDSSDNKNEEKLRSIFEKDKVGIDILKTVFNNVLKNEQMKMKIKENLLSNMCKNEENVINSKYFDSYLKRFLDRTVDNFQQLSILKSTLQNEASDNDEIILDDGEMENMVDVPSFSEYYKNNDMETFRSKILCDTFADVKKN